MKRNRLLIFAVILMIVVSGVKAQYVIQKSDTDVPQKGRIHNEIYTSIKQERNNTKAGNYNLFVSYVNNVVFDLGQGALGAEPVVNDTNVRNAYYENNQLTYSKPFFVEAGLTFDANTYYISNYENGDYRVFGNPYKVDTTYIKGNYRRVTSSDVVDTLVVEFIYGDTSNAYDFRSYNDNGVITNYACPIYKKDTNALNGLVSLQGYGYKCVKLPLTSNDSLAVSNMVKYFAIPTNITVPAKNLFTVMYTFKSGIDKNNYPNDPIYYVSSTAEIDGGATPNINSFSGAYYVYDFEDMQPIFYDESSFSMTHGLTKDQYASRVQNNYYIFLMYDHIGWDIALKLSGDFYVGVREVENVKIMNTYPNPVRKGSFATVQLELANNSNVSYELYDIAGKLIMSEDFGKISSGKRSFEINTNDLRSGIYYYTINAGGSKINNKLMVIE